MALYSKIHNAFFVDDTASADVKRIHWLICDDVDAEYIGGSVSYDFVNDSVASQGLRSLVEAATIKTAIEAIKLDKAKDGTYFTANPLPEVDCIYIKKDGLGNCVSYQEVYKEPQTQESEGGSSGGSTGGGGSTGEGGY